jgi:hypothetical protein
MKFFAQILTPWWAEGFLGWLSRFKLIRLQRISLATLRRDGWRDGQRDGKLMRRRSNHEWAEVWVDRWSEGEGKGVYRFSSLVKQNKKGKNCAVFCFAGKKKLLFYILRCDCEAKNL